MHGSCRCSFFAMNETLPGRRYYWPIYKSAVRHHLPIGIPAGSAFRHAPTSNGWPSHYVQDYVGLSMGFDFAAAQACMAKRRGHPFTCRLFVSTCA